LNPDSAHSSTVKAAKLAKAGRVRSSKFRVASEVWTTERVDDWSRKVAAGTRITWNIVAVDLEKVTAAHLSHRNIAVAPHEGSKEHVELVVKAPRRHCILLIVRDSRTIFDAVQVIGRFMERTTTNSRATVEEAGTGHRIIGIDASASAELMKRTIATGQVVATA
jgi:hypothetical protein